VLGASKYAIPPRTSLFMTDLGSLLHVVCARCAPHAHKSRLISKVRVLSAAAWVAELNAQPLRPAKRRPKPGVATDGETFKAFARAEGFTVPLTAKVLVQGVTAAVHFLNGLSHA